MARSVALMVRGYSAVLMISSDLDEIIGNCDRVVVMRDGETVGEVSGADVAEKPIIRLAHGV